MIRSFFHAVFSITVGTVIFAISTAHAQSGIDKQADRILREMGDYLGNAGEFSFRADVSYDEFSIWDQEIQFGGVAIIALRRPDSLDVAYDGDNRQSRVLFNGETLVFHDLRTNLYAPMEASEGIDNAIDQLFEQSGTSVPIADLLYSNPYETLIEYADFGVVVGQHSIDGISSHHLAFSGEVLDWQIWIETGPRPLPRQLVITYKEDPGAPQYRARLSNWNFKPGLTDHNFDFIPPTDAKEMEFLQVQPVPVMEDIEP
jgi:hypothetical protein